MPECVVAGCTNPPSDELPDGPLPKDAIVCDDHLSLIQRNYERD